MRSIHRKNKVIAALVIATAVIFFHDIVTAVTDKSVSVVGTASKPVMPQALLDDFRYALPMNIWGAATTTFSSSSAACAASYTNDPGGSGYSLKLDYNVGGAGSYSGYSSKLGSSSLSAYTSVSFYVRGAAGGEFFKVALKNAGNEAAVYITDYLDGGVTTSWKKVTIPFHNFVNISSWSSMTDFLIVFENSQSVTNGSPTQGAVYIDNITFETGAVSAVRIDYFGDKLGVSALGGNTGTASSNGTISYSFSSTAGDYNPYPYGLLLNYDVSAVKSWAAAYLIFGGGSTGWVATPHNFSAYNNISISIKAGSSFTNPRKIKIELVDSAGTKFYVIDGIDFPLISTTWYVYKIPLSFFRDYNSFPLDKTSIKQLTFVLEEVQIRDAAGYQVGAVYIDSVQFEQ